MGIYVNSNISSINAQNQMRENVRRIATRNERLATGMRINGARDDAAGLAISKRMEAQVRGYEQAIRNNNDGISLIQTVESALVEAVNLIQRARELAVQSMNDTYNASDRGSIQAEVTQIVREIDRIATKTTFNGQKVLDAVHTRFNLQSGANVGETLAVDLKSARSDALARQARVTAQSAVRTELSLKDGFGFGGGLEDLELNGVEVRDSLFEDDNVSTIDQFGSAIAKAKAINASTEFSSVRAIVGETRTDNQDDRNVDLGFDAFGNSGSIQAFELTGNTYLLLNDVKISGISVQDNDADGSLVSALNAYSEETGVIASVNSNQELTLVAEDGRNIHIQYFDEGLDNAGLFAGGVRADANGADLQALIGLRDGDAGFFTYGGTLTLQSTETIEANLGEFANDALGRMVSSPAFISGEAVFGTNRDHSLASIDVGSKQSAEVAVETLDIALEELSAFRSSLGALNNRLDHTNASIDLTSDNLAVSKARIEEADFAHESAALARESMISAASVSVLSQANQTPEVALQLLQATDFSGGLSSSSAGAGSIV